MDLGSSFSLALIFLVVLALGLTLAWLQRRGWVDPSKERVRRGTGHAMLGLQEFIEPSVEYTFQAENVEQKEEDDLDASGDDPDLIKSDIAASLSRTPIDPEEVRRHLATAVRAGLDWRKVYDEAVRAELAERPYRTPSIPPAFRVAPRE
jgi:hypothetical protein